MLGGAATSATNSGAINAAMAELRANGGDVYTLAENTSGMIRATGTATQGGRVFLVAEGGALSVAGTCTRRTRTGRAAPSRLRRGGVPRRSRHLRRRGWILAGRSHRPDGGRGDGIDHRRKLEQGTDVTLQTTANGASVPGVQNPNVAGDIAATSLGPARTYDQNTTTPAATDLSFDLTMAGTFVGSLA